MMRERHAGGRWGCYGWQAVMDVPFLLVPSPLQTPVSVATGGLEWQMVAEAWQRLLGVLNVSITVTDIKSLKDVRMAKRNTNHSELKSKIWTVSRLWVTKVCKNSHVLQKGFIRRHLCHLQDKRTSFMCDLSHPMHAGITLQRPATLNMISSYLSGWMDGRMCISNE